MHRRRESPRVRKLIKLSLARRVGVITLSGRVRLGKPAKRIHPHQLVATEHEGRDLRRRRRRRNGFGRGETDISDVVFGEIPRERPRSGGRRCRFFRRRGGGSRGDARTRRTPDGAGFLLRRWRISLGSFLVRFVVLLIRLLEDGFSSEIDPAR